MVPAPVAIDGSEGEAGGQILRTALSLSCILGRSFKMTGIRANRPKPGLQAQHLACVRALHEISGAETKGAELHSTTLEFKPGTTVAGEYRFDIGTAGSATLLAETVLPVLALAGGKSRVTIVGGTDVPFSPPQMFPEKVLLPALGIGAKLSLERWGFYPAGGGRLVLETGPSKIRPVCLTERGRLKRAVCYSVAAGLPGVAERQAAAVKKELPDAGREILRAEADSKGSLVFLLAEHERCVNGFSALGRVGKSAEDVGREAVARFRSFERSGAAVEEHLADQLLLWMALADGMSAISAEKISGHAETNMRTIERFIGPLFDREDGLVRCAGGGLLL